MTTDEQAAAASFARDIRPLFRERDISSMLRAAQLDLGDYDAVAGSADAILARLEAGDMPCDGGWPAEQVALFRKWIADGKQA